MHACRKDTNDKAVSWSEPPRSAAARALASFGREAKVAVPSLLEIVANSHGEDSDVRVGAAYALAKVGAARTAIPILMKVVSDDNQNVQRYVIMTLGNIGSKARGAVSEITRISREGRTRFVRQAAAKALKKIQGETLTDDKQR